LEAQFDAQFLQDTRDAFKANKQDNESMRNLELASYFCEAIQTGELEHSPLINDVDLFDFVDKNKFFVHYVNSWRDSATDEFNSRVLMEDGMCMTFNQISVNSIFRNDTVDPKFLKQFKQVSAKMEPQSWSIETGYTSDGTHFYPLKSLVNGPESGFAVEMVVRHHLRDAQGNIDKQCRSNPEFIKIALHHPAEVALKTSFVKMPIYKSVSMMVKPKITTTSDSLKSYDPEV
jgi:hypothetical protein